MGNSSSFWISLSVLIGHQRFKSLIPGVSSGGPLHLTVGNLVPYRSEADFCPKPVTELDKRCACELTSVVCDDPVWDSKPGEDIFVHKLDDSLSVGAPYGLCFYPLCEFVHHNIQVVITIMSFREHAEHVKPQRPQRATRVEWSIKPEQADESSERGTGTWCTSSQPHKHQTNSSVRRYENG